MKIVMTMPSPTIANIHQEFFVNGDISVYPAISNLYNDKGTGASLIYKLYFENALVDTLKIRRNTVLDSSIFHSVKKNTDLELLQRIVQKYKSVLKSRKKASRKELQKQGISVKYVTPDSPYGSKSSSSRSSSKSSRRTGSSLKRAQLPAYFRNSSSKKRSAARKIQKKWRSKKNNKTKKKSKGGRRTKRRSKR